MRAVAKRRQAHCDTPTTLNRNRVWRYDSIHPLAPVYWRLRGQAMTLLARCVARILDFIIGDPPRWPHPVRWIGNLITLTQRIVRRYCRSDRALRVGGALMWLTVVGLTRLLARSVLKLAASLHPGWAGALKCG